MTSLSEIHQSVIDADDLEEIHEGEISVGDVFTSLYRHPKQIIHRWNWKTAFMGALVRSSIYFTIYKASKESWSVTLTAIGVEFAFRFFTSGISGALIQSFRHVTPAWAATAIISFTLPAISHVVEFGSHYAQEQYFSNIFPSPEGSARRKTFAISVLFSIISAMFNIFMMRNGVMLVGAGNDTNSFRDDLKSIPKLILEFILVLPNQIIASIKSRSYSYAFTMFMSFGLVVGIVLGVMRGKWTWAWRPALAAWAILFVWTLLVAGYARFSSKS